MNRIDVAIAIVTRGGLVLICRRPPDAPLGGYWEFPGGKREPGETLEQCLARELEEELAIRPTPTAALDVIDHDYDHARIRLHPFICPLAPGQPEPQPLACAELRWITPPDLRNHPFPPANEALLEQAIAHLTQPHSR